MTNKIAPRHISRKAIVYVRQSSQHQVLRNTESRRLQYEMKQRVLALGWIDVEVIDDDLGRSATGIADRTGFQRMVADVCLGKVGAVAAREVSRFARNNRDWHQLIEMCSMVDTLLVDHEAIYDPRQPNDRLLLGLKGSMSEYEIDLLRQRSLEARWAKARRGELVIEAPVGFVKTPGQEIELDPDLRVQKAVRLVFEKAREFGSARQALMWFIERGITLPAKRRVDGDWQTWWRRPAYRNVHRILTDPTYAGAYAYGRTTARTEVREGALEKHRARKPLKEWTVLLRDHHEGYITWIEFEKMQAMLAANVANYRQDRAGAAKRGGALLTGLIRCRRCGRKLMVRYTGQKQYRVPRYCCHRGSVDNGEQRCISFGAIPVDEALGRELLRVVQPAAVEAAAAALAEDSHKQDEVVAALLLELQAARYAVDRAWKQYDAVDPVNRLVATELERRWNEALAKAQGVQARLDEEQSCSRARTPVELQNMHGLADDLVRAWNDPEADRRTKKRIIRTLIAEVVADIDVAASEVELVIHWRGGVHSTLRVHRRRRGQSNAQTNSDTIETIRILARVCTDDVIASSLNRSGVRTGVGNRWTRERVTSARCKRSIPKYDEARQRAEGWMKLGEAAQHLGIAAKTLRRAVDAGLLPAIHPLADGPWVFQRADLDAPVLRERLVGLQSEGAGPSRAQLSLAIPGT